MYKKQNYRCRDAQTGRYVACGLGDFSYSTEYKKNREEAVECVKYLYRFIDYTKEMAKKEKSPNLQKSIISNMRDAHKHLQEVAFCIFNV